MITNYVNVTLSLLLPTIVIALIPTSAIAYSSNSQFFTQTRTTSLLPESSLTASNSNALAARSGLPRRRVGGGSR
jgi:hypothetical protein